MSVLKIIIRNISIFIGSMPIVIPILIIIIVLSSICVTREGGRPLHHFPPRRVNEKRGEAATVTPFEICELRTLKDLL